MAVNRSHRLAVLRLARWAFYCNNSDITAAGTRTRDMSRDMLYRSLERRRRPLLGEP